MSNPILSFLEGRKQKPLKEAKKTVSEIEMDYSISIWVANAAQRAAQLSLVSHPAKFSHPDARTSPILFKGDYKADGFLRSGNALAAVDVVGNAAALDVYTFLSLPLEDGKTVLEHFENQSPELKQLLSVDEDTFQHWRSGFLQIKSTSDVKRTNSNIKQVYFPVGDDYHLLSILYPSGLITENRERIRNMKFSEVTKTAREARSKSHYHADGFADMSHLLVQHFGGTKPQNISKLNSNNGGEAWLLPCFPPELDLLRPHLPRKNFFYEVRLDEEQRAVFKAFRNLLIAGLTVDALPREKFLVQRDQLVSQVFHWLVSKAEVLQVQTEGWTNKSNCQLPEIQKIWLDAAHEEVREGTTDWLDDIAEGMTRWFFYQHKRSLKGHPLSSKLEMTYSVEGDTFQAIARNCLKPSVGAVV
jgi:CRISPR-associated protein Csy1